MEYILLILFLYASYLTIEKYVHTGHIFDWRGRSDSQKEKTVEIKGTDREQNILVGKSRYEIRTEVTLADSKRQTAAAPENPFTFTSETQTTAHLPIHLPPVSSYNGPVGDRQENDGKEAGGCPDRYEITGYVERPFPYRARGVTFDDLEIIDKVMKSDETGSGERSRARESLRRLEGTDMERILRAGVLGSSEKLKRYMSLYADPEDKGFLDRKDKERVLRDFDLTEYVPPAWEAGAESE